MSRNGKYIGSHGYSHSWLNALPPEKQKQEVKLSLEFIKKVGSHHNNWVACYPYGAYNNPLITILKKENCKLALTTKTGIASLKKDNGFTLERLDTNDLPKLANAKPNKWTKKVLS